MSQRSCSAKYLLLRESVCSESPRKMDVIIKNILITKNKQTKIYSFFYCNMFFPWEVFAKWISVWKKKKRESYWNTWKISCYTFKHGYSGKATKGTRTARNSIRPLKTEAVIPKTVTIVLRTVTYSYCTEDYCYCTENYSYRTELEDYNHGAMTMAITLKTIVIVRWLRLLH